MGYANYDKVQIFHMTCTCMTPLSTRDRLTRHVNRDARAMCVHTHVRHLYTTLEILEFPGTRGNPSEIYVTQRELHSLRPTKDEGDVSWEPDYFEEHNEAE